MKLVNIAAGFIVSSTLIFSTVNPANAASTERKLNMSYLAIPKASDYLETVERTNGALDMVAPNYFKLNEDGTLKLSTAISKSFIDEMHKQKIKVIPYITDEQNKTKGKLALQKKEELATQIAAAVQTYSLDGINVDLEGVNETNKQSLTDFIKLLDAKLPADKIISVAVAANPNEWSKGWHGAYDYKELSRYSDFLMIMAYDEHWSGSAPGPVASLPFSRKSTEYAIGQGVSKQKIVLGLPFYGRLWNTDPSKGVNGHGISLSRVDALLTAYHGKIEYDKQKNSPKATFEIKQGDVPFHLNSWSEPLPAGKYVLWYENDLSLKEKLNLVQEYEIKGTGSWSLSQENTKIWDFYRLWLDGKRFSDISKHYWANEAIWKAVQEGWMLGTSATTFSPGRSVTRDQAAVILVRALKLKPKTALTQSFTDVSPASWAYKEIEIARQHGLFLGNHNQFEPGKTLNRLETAVVLHRILGNGGKEVPEKPSFTDVPAGHWAYDAVEILKARGIYNGYSTQKFNPPNAPAVNTRAQMAVLLNRIEPYLP